MQLDTILLKVTSRCNINCSYCYVYNKADLNLDGAVDNTDLLEQRLAYQQGVYSTISNY